VRHAKALPPDSQTEDIDRPLSDKGRGDAAAMAAWLAKTGAAPDVIVSSPAKRAFRTAQAFAEAFNAKAITVDQRVYEASPSELLDLMRGMQDKFATCVLVGHNPGLSELLALLSLAPTGELATCAVACVDFDEARSWISIKPNSGRLRLLFEPSFLKA